MKRFLLAALIGVVVAGETKALDANNKYQGWIPADILTCGKYVKERRSKNKQIQIVINAWIMGYGTAVNRHVKGEFDFFKNVDTESISLAIENYCLRNPTNLTFGGMQVITRELINK